MKVRASLIFVLATAILFIGLAACGGDFDEESREFAVQTDSAATAATAVPAPAAAPAAAPTAAPAAPGAPTAVPAMAGSPGEASGQFFETSPMGHAQAAALAQSRIIVRTVDIVLVVSDVAAAADRIDGLVRGVSGWKVSSDRTHKHLATIAVRVPAEVLDQVVLELRGMALDVESETSTSQDVTDEYVDTEARLNGLLATEARLLEFLDRAGDVEDALNVQLEISRVQTEKETILGRLRFLQETSAYSLMNIVLQVPPDRMRVDVGPDATFSAGQFASFRATFSPPSGVDEFTFSWDFGDGSGPVHGNSSAPTTNPGERVTATVTHTYDDERYSPYIVQLVVKGSGDAGLAEGSDTLEATVTRVPTIEVFAGEHRTVDEGEEVEYGGSFTRPEGLWDLRYRWDFGDGSATVIGVPEEGLTRSEASHVYRDYRPQPYRVTLTVTAQSEAGEVEGSGSFEVRVNESEGFVVAGWNAGGHAKSAVRALSVFGQVLGTIAIWLGIFSPVWIIGGFIIFFLPRLRRRLAPGLPGGGAPDPNSLSARVRRWRQGGDPDPNSL